MSIERLNPRERVAAHHRSGSGTVRIGYPIGIRTVPLLRKEQVSPRMVRLTLGGPSLNGFHSYQADDHVMIVFPDPDGTLRLPVANDRLMLDWPRPLPTARKYTVRRFDAESGELDLDFVLHPGGTASEWALAAEPGDQVSIAGPPGAKAFPHTYDHYVFAVDATALPAAARWLEESPSGVSAHFVIETEHADEHAYPLAPRAGVEFTRLVRERNRSRLAATVEALDLPPTGVFLFAAGEADDIKPLRAWARGRLDALFTGYWKRGVAGLDD
ncbi:siderophore-interacting protein [Streptomyces sp. SID8352]|uniref:siderophore-interacting protein n=1 Tax=Streptomyces sp. SID8352 TaxID=2690338 RepID=UPI00136D9555|nr:siderophore-interacting protein [Streptomyces sp. SID8352]MYU26285.1 SIP domain-containing protein [Streptomyces sp. SID8352]